VNRQSLDPDQLEAQGLTMMAAAERNRQRLVEEEQAKRDAIAAALVSQIVKTQPEGDNPKLWPYVHRKRHLAGQEAYETPADDDEAAIADGGPVLASPPAAGGWLVWLRGSDWRTKIVAEKWTDDCPCQYLRRESKYDAQLLDHGRVVLRKTRLSASEMQLPIGELEILYPQPTETTDGRSGSNVLR